MRHSPLRHPIAVLRQIIGIGQTQLGKLVDRSPRTIQSIELGKHTLSEDLAHRMSQETGVAFAWLRDGHPDVIPWVEGPVRVPYEKEHFERIRAYIAKGQTPSFLDVVGDAKAMEAMGKDRWASYRAEIGHENSNWPVDLPIYLREILAAVTASNKAGRYHLALYRISQFADSMKREFGQCIDEEFLGKLNVLQDQLRSGIQTTQRVVKRDGPIFWSPHIPEREWGREAALIIETPAFVDSGLIARDIIEGWQADLEEEIAIEAPRTTDLRTA